MKRLIALTSLGLLLLVPAGCAKVYQSGPRTVTEKYRPAMRQLPPEPVYSRLMWSHSPQPIPAATAKKAPYLQPVIQFEFPNSNLEEAIQALAQTMGYRWSLPKELSSRGVSINQSGTVDEILGELGRQARVNAHVDHEQRVVFVVDETTNPKLPRSE